MVQSCIYNSPIGILELCGEKDMLTKICFCSGTSESMQSKAYEQPSGLLYETCRQLDEYFMGKRTKFDLPVSLEGTAFQQKVWRALREIPYGETRSYEDIAVSIGNKKAVRAVGQANNKNPLLIVVPCHRVINKSGGLGGFACGMEAKQYLLDLERNAAMDR